MKLEQFNVNLRRPCLKDVDRLHNMIVESTGGRTKISSADLYADLLLPNHIANPEVTNNDPCLNFDVKLLQTDRATLQAILAEVDEKLIGYLMFSYYYSPWMGHCAQIADIFISKQYRKNGIATELMNELSKLCRTENLAAILCNVEPLDQALKTKIKDHGFLWYRGDDADWSVLRINL